jgi:hypothetical protein
VFFFAADVFCTSFRRASSAVRADTPVHGPDISVVVLFIIAPFLRPANKVGDTPPLLYYL